MELELIIFVTVSAFLIGGMSGMLGIGGGILMAPALLVGPGLLGYPELDMKQVAGLTITLSLVASCSSLRTHARDGSVDRRLMIVMGSIIAATAFFGAVQSSELSNARLQLVFAGCAALAAILMLVPTDEPTSAAASAPSPRPARSIRAGLIAGSVGVAGGLIGQSGSFMLIPLMRHGLGLELRKAMATNLGVVLVASTAGFIGHYLVGHIIPALATAVLLGAVPGAVVGAAIGRRLSTIWLRYLLAIVIGLSAIEIARDAGDSESPTDSSQR